MHHEQHPFLGLFKGYLQRVIDWNKACGNENFTQAQIDKQIGYTISEIRETIELGIESNNFKEIVDGIVDVFVTYGYFLYLKTNGEYLEQINALNDPVLTTLTRITDNLSGTFYTTGNYNTFLIDLFEPLLAYEEVGLYESGTVCKWIEAVLDSNDSKLIDKDVFDADPDSFMDAVNTKYAGEFTNITALLVKNGDKDMYVLKADGGAGKILKPHTFFEPNIEV